MPNARSTTPPRAVSSAAQQERDRPEASDVEERLASAMRRAAAQEDEPLVPASGGSCRLDVALTDQGGVALSYGAPPGQEQELRSAVHAMAARHNARSFSPGDRGTLNDAMALTQVESVAVVEDTAQGARVVLVPDEAWELAELFAHTEMHAPDLLPATVLAQRCPRRGPGPDR